jgi:Lrp/AsnC family transcriptional regulator for asnA, asnC and gidA
MEYYSIFMDETDKNILEILKINSKLTTSRISKKIAVPITTVHNRMKKLEKEEIIKNYTVNIDYEKIGLPLCAYILITVNYELKDGTKVKQENIAKNIRKLQEVEEVHIVTGATDIMIKARFSDISNMNKFVIDKLRSIQGVDKTQTMMVLSSY